MAMLPNLVLNVIFTMWIYLALRRTLNYLVTKEQRYKFTIITKIFVSLCVCIIATGILMLTQMFSMLASNRDESWSSQWSWEACWFLIFSGFSIAVVVILRPDEMSDMLTVMQEVLDETLNEMHVEEIFGDDNEHMVNDHGFEMHEFGRKQK